jgi:hypothetical protein
MRQSSTSKKLNPNKLYTMEDILEAIKKQIGDPEDVAVISMGKPRGDFTGVTSNLSVEDARYIDGNHLEYIIRDDGNIRQYKNNGRKKDIVGPYYKRLADTAGIQVDTPYSERQFPSEHYEKMLEVFQQNFPQETAEESIIYQVVGSIMGDGGRIAQIVDALHDEGVDASLYMPEIKQAMKEYRHRVKAEQAAIAIMAARGSK